MTTKSPLLRNAVEMSEKHAKFDSLPYQRRANLEVGDSAKVCAVFNKGVDVGGERFWVVVIAVDAEKGCYQGFVNNVLSHSDAHGLYFRDVICFEPRHIYDVVLTSEADEMNRKAREEMSKPGFENETLKPYDENQA